MKLSNLPTSKWLCPDGGSGLVPKFGSVTQLCLTLCDPMDCSTPGFPVLHHLPDLLKLMSFESMIPTISFSVVTFSSRLQSFPASGSFLISWLLASGCQSIRASASTSVLLMNIQSWFTLGKIDWFDLLAVQGTLKRLLQHHSSKASVLRCSEFQG